MSRRPDTPTDLAVAAYGRALAAVSIAAQLTDEAGMRPGRPARDRYGAIEHWWMFTPHIMIRLCREAGALWIAQLKEHRSPQAEAVEQLLHELDDVPTDLLPTRLTPAQAMRAYAAFHARRQE